MLLDKGRDSLFTLQLIDDFPFLIIVKLFITIIKKGKSKKEKGFRNFLLQESSSFIEEGKVVYTIAQTESEKLLYERGASQYIKSIFNTPDFSLHPKKCIIKKDKRDKDDIQKYENSIKIEFVENKEISHTCEEFLFNSSNEADKFISSLLENKKKKILDYLIDELGEFTLDTIKLLNK